MNTELIVALARLAIQHGPKLYADLREIFAKEPGDPELLKRFDAAVETLKKDPEHYFGPRFADPTPTPNPWPQPEPPTPTPEPPFEPTPFDPQPPTPPPSGETFRYFAPLKTRPGKPPLKSGDELHELPDGRFWAKQKGFGAPVPTGAKLIWKVE